MTEPLYYLDRYTQKLCQEKVYGGKGLTLLYGDGLLSTILGKPLSQLVARIPFFSAFYGYLQKRPASAKKIIPFIQTFGVDTTEFADSVSSYHSFNDFFIRKLKPSCRPIAANPKSAIIPADGRYLFFQNLNEVEGFLVKGEKFSLETLLQDKELAKEYAQGSMAIARLCPTDYHRYHFPCDCTPGESHLINGWLYSVNPIALKKNIHIFTLNKRTLCPLESKNFGKVLFLEIGATFVGAIHQTYTPFKEYKKGAEKGYFSFGASSLIVLFPPNAIRFDDDLLNATKQQVEIKCLMGQSMGQTY